MKIFHDRILVDEVPVHRQRPGEFFSRLVGVNLSSDGKYISAEPIYMPLVRVQKGECQITIWVNNYERPLWMVFLSRRWPIIRVFRYNWLLLDEADNR